MPSYKSIVLADELANELVKRCAPLAVVQGVDSSGNSTITVGTNAAGSPGCFIRLMPVVYPNSFNVIGQASTIYTPDVLQLVTEANPAGGAGADINTVAQLLSFLAPSLRKGTTFEWYLSANGTPPSVSAITGTPAGTFDDLYWPLISAQ